MVSPEIDKVECRLANRLRRGIFLLEAVAGILILISALLTMTVVLHGSTNYFNQAEKVNRASLLGRSEQVRLRNQAITFTGFQSLLTMGSATQREGDFVAQSDVRPWQLDSPSKNLEQPFGANARRFDSSCVLVTTRVTWPGSHSGTEPVFETIIAEPARQPSTRVQINQSSGPGGTVELQATLEDSSGSTIPDVSFQWHVVGGPGRGRLTPVDRLGQSVGLQVVTPGAMLVEATSYYRGQRIAGVRNVR